MAKNKLEKRFSEAIRENPNIWYLKLQVMPLAHVNMPADYLLLVKKNFAIIKDDKSPEEPHYIGSEERTVPVLVECKQVTCEDGENGRLAFKRLKQFHDLLAFLEFHPSHKAFICVAFKESFWRNSDTFLLPAKQFKDYIDNCQKVSINREEMKQAFPECKIDLDKIDWGGRI